MLNTRWRHARSCFSDCASNSRLPLKVSVNMSHLRSEELKTVIREAVRDIIKEEITDKLTNLEAKVNALTDMQNAFADLKNQVAQNEAKYQVIEDSQHFMNDQLENIKTKEIPSINKKMMDITSNLCINHLDLDTHRRKWTLIVNGLSGQANEPELETRKAVRKFGLEKLKVPNADTQPFAACHRLAQKADAGIIIRFVDLSHRNAWLGCAKNLKVDGSNVSLSPDLHPCLRQLKTDVLLQRKSLPETKKKGTQVKYCPTWPYVYLRLPDGSTMNPRINKETVVKSLLPELAQ